MATMTDDVDAGADGVDGVGAPVWAVFGDLMSGLLGAFVLILMCVIGAQLETSARLQAEVKQRQAEEQRRHALEQALAVPLAAGRVTLDHGRIGINGSVLFAFNSAELQPEGQQLLKTLAGPLAAYLRTRDEVLMVSGFTDDRQVRERTRSQAQRFADNWELSAQRALTVTRALIEAGVPSSSVFAAAFGSEQPVASNADPEGRAKNRRVEMAPTPRPARAAASAPQAGGPGRGRPRDPAAGRGGGGARGGRVGRGGAPCLRPGTWAATRPCRWKRR